MLMLKLTFSSSVTRGVGSIRGMVNNQDDTYIIGADRNVLMTIPDVTLWKQETHLITQNTPVSHQNTVYICSPLRAPCCSVQRRWPRWVQWGRLHTGRQSSTNLCGWRSCCSLLRPECPPCLYRPAASPGCRDQA